VFAICGGAVAIPARRLPSGAAILVGAMSAIVSVALLALSADRQSLVLFTTSLVFGGISYSLLFSGGLGLLNANAPAHHRGGTLSALFLVAYLTQGVAALLLGKIATLYKLALAVDAGSLIVAGLSLGAIVLSILYASFRPVPQPITGNHR
jgi:hypothetical protein